MNPPRPDALPDYPAAPHPPTTIAPPPAPTESKTARLSLVFGVVALVAFLANFTYSTFFIPRLYAEGGATAARAVGLNLLLAPLFAWGIYAGVAVALGHVAANAVRQSGGGVRGGGMARAGLALGYGVIALSLFASLLAFIGVNSRLI